MEHINGVDLNMHTHIIFYFADIISQNKHVKLQSIKNQTETIVMKKWIWFHRFTSSYKFSLKHIFPPF